jgi:hypothetical protein
LSADSEWDQRKLDLAAYVNSHHVWVVVILRHSPRSSRHISGFGCGRAVMIVIGSLPARR